MARFMTRLKLHKHKHSKLQCQEPNEKKLKQAPDDVASIAYDQIETDAKIVNENSNVKPRCVFFFHSQNWRNCAVLRHFALHA